MSHTVVPIPLSTRIFTALLVLTVVTIVVSLIDLGAWNPAVAMTIASIKAGLVALYFMGIRWADRLTRAALVVALAFVAILFGGALNDELTRHTKTYRAGELRPEMVDFSIQGLDGLTPELPKRELPADAEKPAH